jgi:hypothetical protein
VGSLSLCHIAKSRWEIENQGFNDAKNRYGLEHTCHQQQNSISLVWLITFLATGLSDSIESATCIAVCTAHSPRSSCAVCWGSALLGRLRLWLIASGPSRGVHCVIPLCLPGFAPGRSLPENSSCRGFTPAASLDQWHLATHLATSLPHPGSRGGVPSPVLLFAHTRRVQQNSTGRRRAGSLQVAGKPPVHRARTIFPAGNRARSVIGAASPFISAHHRRPVSPVEEPFPGATLRPIRRTRYLRPLHPHPYLYSNRLGPPPLFPGWLLFRRRLKRHPQ